VLASKPTADETAIVLEAIEHLRKSQSDPGRPTSESAIRARVVHVLLNHNDFVTIR
jgi:hypothetical protein